VVVVVVVVNSKYTLPAGTNNSITNYWQNAVLLKIILVANQRELEIVVSKRNKTQDMSYMIMPC
jgi:hypothetical protein